MSDESTLVASSVEKLAGKYLTFRLGAEEYGIPILRVREIVGLMDITPVPSVPAHIRGVVNLRGRIIPIVDLRTKFGMAAFEEGDESCIIVLEFDNCGATSFMGALVDGVREVVDIPAAEIAPTPEMGLDSGSRFVLAIAKSKGAVRILLDVEQALNFVSIAAAAELV